MATVPADASVPADTSKVFTPGKALVWLIAAVVFAYLLWLAIANLVSVSGIIQQNNAFLRANGGGALQSSVPWIALGLDVLIAPLGFAVAWFVSRRMTVGRVVVVFLVAFCAAGAVWFDVLEYVSTTGRIGA